jgi:hypothetical protein
MDAFDVIGREIDEIGSDQRERHPFYMFEPWDVAKRSQAQLDQAERDGVDLFDPQFIKHAGQDPHPYQTGFLLSTAFIRSLQAGTQVGKSYVALMEAGVVLSGEIPHSLRFAEGVDTGVKRLVNKENILRWGRFDSTTGSFLDHNANALKPQGWSEWDCGTIKGVGIYPTEKIAPPGSQIWVCTLMRGIVNFWWPKLYEPEERIFPDHFFDKSKGNNGYNLQKETAYFNRGGKIMCISYESGFDKTEERMAKMIIMDEPPPHDLFQSAQQHCEHLVIVETPYKGVSFTKALMWPDKPSPEKKVFHATQYDSPYVSNDKIELLRENMKPWDIGARVWGLHTEVKGEPYYDRHKLMIWLRKYQNLHELGAFIPEGEYYGLVDDPNVNHLRGLINTRVDFQPSDIEDGRYVWRVYEKAEQFTPYVLTADPAEGSEKPEEAQDVCAAMVARPLTPDERASMPGAVTFKVVATIRSSLPTIAFARTCSHAARYYNNALLGAETRRGFWNGTFANELSDWPYWYMITTIHDKTGTPRKNKGFDPNQKTRESMYDLISDWINAFSEKDYPHFRDEWIIKELTAAVVGKNGRCDHTSEGTLDTVTCFGIMLYIFKFSANQIQFNGDVEEQDYKPKNPHHRNVKKKVDHCGMGLLGYRQD